MTDLSVQLLGIGLGLRHATDSDHVVVVSALVH
jgi:high-affinity nickel permease